MTGSRAERRERRVLRGQALRVARQEALLTQRQVADAVGCTQSLISEIEHGRCGIDLDLLPLLCRILSRPLEYFIAPELPPELPLTRGGNASGNEVSHP